MKQAVLLAPGNLIIREVEHPKLLPDQVLIKIRRIGICGSDIHVFQGTHPYTGYPIVQGHEVSGVVAELGENVTDLNLGEQVVFLPQITCGNCFSCRNHKEHICDHLKVMGFQSNGAAQEYFPVDASKVLITPPGVSPDQAAMIEPLAVAVHALSRYGDVTGKSVLVLGAGTIGNLVAQTARAMGARKVLITDISEYKLSKARECGIPSAVNPFQVNLGEVVGGELGHDKADVILECAGVQDTISQAVENARKGSFVVVVGVFDQKAAIDLGLIQDREITITGTLMYQKRDYEQALSLINKGSINLETMITHRFPFSDYPEAYQAIEALNGEFLKVMIEMPQ